MIVQITKVELNGYNYDTSTKTYSLVNTKNLTLDGVYYGNGTGCIAGNFGNVNVAYSKIELKIQPPEYMDGYTGAADDAFLTVQIKDNIDRNDVVNTIHHEFRHHKQKYWAYRYSPEQYMSALNKKIEKTSNGKCKNAWKDVDKMINWLDENLGENTREKDFPTQYTTFAKKCSGTVPNFIDHGTAIS